MSAFRDKLGAAEQGGARAAWIANHLFQRDPVSLAAMALASTRRMRVALMAVSPFTVHPVQAAMAAATLDELFPGRVTLCLGAGAPADLRSVGIDAARPLWAMREALAIVRALLDGETVAVAGETFRAQGRRLAGGRRGVPVMLAASGPQMLDLAGSAADGVLISAGASVEFLRWTLDGVRRAAAGRTVRCCGLVYGSVDADESRAHDRLRRSLAILLRGAHHERNLQLAGSSLDRAALDRAVVAEDWAAAAALVTDDVVRRHAASGTPEQVEERFAAYHAAGLDEIVLAGVGDGEQVARLVQLERRQGTR
nr:LLM class flavin-dependent oxidoreductase [Rhodoplanes tepidamans]